MKILLIEDDPAIQKVMKMIFDDLGHNTAAYDYADNIEKILKKDKPDLIFLDVLLGSHNGADIVKKLKLYPKYRKIPAILISAHNDIAKIADDAGADNFLAKPFDISELEAMVRKYQKNK